jgi:hypothetical protein
MSKDSEKVLRSYHCRVCATKHKVILQKKIIENQSKFPFSYFFLHGDLKNILTTLYLDRHLEIRGVDVQKLTDDDIFSKEQVVSITSTLVKEIEELRNENEELRLKLKEKTKKVI